MATFFTFLTWINIHIQQFLRSKNFQISESFDSQGVAFAFKSTQELSRDILGWPNKSKIAGCYIFPLANLQNGLGRDFVPDENIGKYSERLFIGRSNIRLKYYIIRKIVQLPSDLHPRYGLNHLCMLHPFSSPGRA